MSFAEKMTAIGDAIRGKTGKAEKLSLDAMATEINEISGGERDINPEWTNWSYFCQYRDSLAAKLKYSDTSNGTNFSYMFYYCSDLTTFPALDTSNGTDFSYMCAYCSNVKTSHIFNTNKGTNLGYMFRGCTSLITAPALDTSNNTTFSNMFNACSSLTTIPAYNTSKGTNFGYMFYNCYKLTSIPQLDVTLATSTSAFNNTFSACRALVDLNIVGTINATNLNVQNSPLSHDSLMSIINALADKTGVSGTWKVTLGATNLAKLTADEIAIAEGKGWTLA